MHATRLVLVLAVVLVAVLAVVLDSTPDGLAALAGEALEEFRAGETQPLDPDNL